MTTTLEIDQGLLDAFIGDGSITDVLYVVRSGKEATVYCCRGAEGELVAAKVYRPLERRNFHNDAIYQTGRDAVLSSRTKRALANKSRHGRDVQYGTWIHAEFQTMRMLYDAGADVPEVAFSPEPVQWLLWRQDLRTYFRSLQPGEAQAFEAAREGQSFGEVCAALCDEFGEAQAPATAAGFLRGWVESASLVVRSVSSIRKSIASSKCGRSAPKTVPMIC